MKQKLQSTVQQKLKNTTEMVFDVVKYCYCCSKGVQSCSKGEKRKLA